MFGLNIIYISEDSNLCSAHESFQHNCGLPINATRMRQSLRYKYILCFRGNRTTHTSQHHCSFLLELITLRYQEDETYYLAASPIYAINQHFVEAVGLEPTHTRHQILSLARLPITTRPELKHPNDFRSHICRVPDGFNSPSPYEPKTLINILTPWNYPIL